MEAALEHARLRYGEQELQRYSATDRHCIVGIIGGQSRERPHRMPIAVDSRFT
jgi:hypothetical protein